VRRDDHGRAARRGVGDQVHDLEREVGVEVAGRLVGEQDVRLVDQRARDRDALLLAARERERALVAAVLQADLLQHLEHARARDAARCRDHVERERDVLLDGAAREQLEVLEHDADPAPQLGHRARREPRRVAPEHDDLALARALGGEHQAQAARSCRRPTARSGTRTRRA
jgi:hypothetical protein